MGSKEKNVAGQAKKIFLEKVSLWSTYNSLNQEKVKKRGCIFKKV